MRTWARSLRSPAREILVGSLNRIHDQLTQHLTAHPELMAAFGDDVDEALRATGFRRYDVNQFCSPSDVVAHLRKAQISHCVVH